MHIKSIIAAAAIALIAGVGSVSADEITVDRSPVNTGTLFAVLDGIATEQMSFHELAATRGAGGVWNSITNYNALRSFNPSSGGTYGYLGYGGSTGSGDDGQLVEMFLQ